MDPFHVVRLAGQALDECRRRVQQAIHGHRGRKGDPLYAARRTLHTGADLLTDKQKDRLTALFADDQHVELEATWGIYQRMIGAYREPDRKQAKILMEQLIASVSSGVPTALTEIVTLGRTLKQRAADVLPTSTDPAPATGRLKRSTAGSSICAALPSASATSPTTSRDACSRPEALDPDYTVDWDEPSNRAKPPAGTQVSPVVAWFPSSSTYTTRACHPAAVRRHSITSPGRGSDGASGVCSQQWRRRGLCPCRADSVASWAWAASRCARVEALAAALRSAKVGRPATVTHAASGHRTSLPHGANRRSNVCSQLSPWARSQRGECGCVRMQRYERSRHGPICPPGHPGRARSVRDLLRSACGRTDPTEKVILLHGRDFERIDPHEVTTALMDVLPDTKVFVIQERPAWEAEPL
jgi:hypothetical protein